VIKEKGKGHGNRRFGRAE